MIFLCLWKQTKGWMAKYRHFNCSCDVRKKLETHVTSFPFGQVPSLHLCSNLSSSRYSVHGFRFWPRKTQQTLHNSANSVAFHIKALGRWRWRRLCCFILASALTFALGLVRFQPRIFEVVFFLCVQGTSGTSVAHPGNRKHGNKEQEWAGQFKHV